MREQLALEAIRVLQAPSLGELARVLKIEKTAAQRVVAQLLERGVIARTEPPTPHSRVFSIRTVEAAE